MRASSNGLVGVRTWPVKCLAAIAVAAALSAAANGCSSNGPRPNGTGGAMTGLGGYGMGGAGAIGDPIGAGGMSAGRTFPTQACVDRAHALVAMMTGDEKIAQLH